MNELRVLLGEDREDTLVPLQFVGYWVSTSGPAAVGADRSDNAAAVAQLPADAPLLVIAPANRRWLRAYEPVSSRVGYVWPNDARRAADRPAQFDNLPTVLARELGPRGSETLLRANLIVRTVAWGSFGVVYLLLLRYTARSAGQLSTAGAGAVLALLYLAAG